MSAVPEEIDVDAPVRTATARQQWDVTAAVAVGGVIGAEARYGVGLVIAHAPDAFPWSTVVINVVGCFCLGLLMSFLGQLSAPHRLIRPFVGIGILGGFTTFSTFSVDAERLVRDHRVPTAGLYVLITLVAAALAVAAATVVAQLAGNRLRHRRRRRTATRRDNPGGTS